MIEKVNLADKLSRFDEHWSPKVVAELNGHRVLAYDPRTGAVSTVFGTAEAGADLSSLRRPAAVLVHAGLVWVADLGNHRILTVPVPDEYWPESAGG